MDQLPLSLHLSPVGAAGTSLIGAQARGTGNTPSHHSFLSAVACGQQRFCPIPLSRCHKGAWPCCLGSRNYDCSVAPRAERVCPWFRSKDHKATHLQTSDVQPMLKLIKMLFSLISDKADVPGVTPTSSVFPSSLSLHHPTPQETGRFCSVQ